MNHPPLRITALAAVCTTVALAIPVAASASPPTSSSRTTMLVMLRGSGATSSVAIARARALEAQAGVASLVSRLGDAVLARTSVPDTLTVRLDASQAGVLAADPLVARVVPNTTIPGPPRPSVVVARHRGGQHPRHRRLTGSCGTLRHPQLNPEALRNINDVPGATLGYDGKGVTVAFLADGLQIANADFKRNGAFASAGSPKGRPVITQYRDFSGDGTAAASPGGEAFLDASSIAAQGNAVYDLSRFVDPSHPLPPGCDIRIVGSAPGATVQALKIFSAGNATTISGFVQAINYAVSHGVSVINESFGSNGFPDTSEDVVRIADEAAVAAGVTVVVSSGDAGINSSIGSPSTDPAVLSVGASTTFRAYQQDTFGGINLPGERGRFIDNNISSLSSGGFAQDAKTVDLVAPGDLNWTLCATSPAYSDCAGQHIQLSGGTSESSPLTAGAAADVIEAYRASHGGASPTPALVMQILTSSATDLATPATQQGAGLLNVGAAVRLALAAPGTTRTARPGGLLASTSQLNLAGSATTPVTQSVTLTNTSSSVLHVNATTRGFVTAGVTGGAILLDPSTRSRQPRFRVWSGAKEVYRTVQLHVAHHVARIQLEAAYGYDQQSSLLHVALFSPSGALAGYSNPQGIGDYADVEVARPAAGIWTAAFFTVWDGDSSGGSGTSGRIPFTFTELRFARVGTATPSVLSLAPGASSSVQYNDVLPTAPGDTAASIVLRTSGVRGVHVASIPVTLRTFVAVGASGGHFRSTLTGGNGRAGAPGQTNTYVFAVPAAKRDLDVALAMAVNPPRDLLPADQLIAMLVDPSGNVVAYDTNFTVTAAGEVETRFVDLYRASPVPGTWELVVDWVQPGTGVRTAVPFTGSIEFNQVSVTGALPNSAATAVPTSGASYTITVHNKGVAPMIVSPDARLASSTTYTLGDLGGVSATQPLRGASNTYYVPTETSSLGIAETATVPATFDVSFAPGDPDLSPLVASAYVTESWSTSAASLTYAPPGGVSAGVWNVAQDEVGPYPRSGSPDATETTTVTATALAFDPAVTSSVADSVEALTTGTSIAPEFIAPGATRSMTVTITPTATVGTVVTGTLFIDGLTPGSNLTSTIGLTAMFTSELGAIPYTYTVAP